MPDVNPHAHEMVQVYSSDHDGSDNRCMGDIVVWCKSCGLTRVVAHAWDVDGKSTILIKTFELGAGLVDVKETERK